ncbi:hypothetical protein Poli38472_014345 [Pythium oligandrum]|uniref:WLGC domain-containing protein n=1 Tax=Pythium oligandrum TaxID=41045 RepID=A0A8K1C725_PYTOL|nr:hypothetical protein Poli38472_014345 [Pythium oligandrum]|eukprot:TMW57742.1 hypothetical protein Poli38472_014345 [Pythium oligandrum]
MSGVMGLAIIAVMYALLACWSLVRIEKITVASRLKVIQSLHQRASTLTSKIRLDRPWTQFLRFRSRHRRRWMVMLEVVEVSLQVITLRNLLLRGHQLSLIFVYVVLVFINCSTTFYFVSIAWKRDFFDEMAVDAILDMCFAVFFPATQLTYAIKSFRGDFEMLRIRQQYSPAKPFERRGRIYGDPEQMSIFSTTIEGLRLRTAGDVANVLLFNFLTCVRWGSIIRIARKKMRKITESPDAKAISPTCVNSVVRKPSAASKPTHTQVSARTVPSIVGTLFLFTGIVLPVLTAKAVNTSTLLCDSFVSSCPVYAYHWLGEDTKASCPCLVFISQSINPTYEELASPPDIMTNLSIFAEAGTLRTIQIIKRGITPELPPAVQNCVQLQQLILINAQVIRMPNWTATTFANLEYLQSKESGRTDIESLPNGTATAFPRLELLHIEGRDQQANLQSIPMDLFDHMTNLRTLRLVTHDRLMELPTFEPLVRLEILHLQKLSQLTTLPSLSSMSSISTLALLYISDLLTIPDLSHLEGRLKYAAIRGLSACCNGFFSNGTCDDQAIGCMHQVSQMSPEVCNGSTPESAKPQASSGTIRALAPFQGSDDMCNDTRFSLEADFWANPTDTCEGVLYRQCETGICFARGLDRVKCDADSAVIAMRKAMITRGVPCDAREEAWLGCQ